MLPMVLIVATICLGALIVILELVRYIWGPQVGRGIIECTEQSNDQGQDLGLNSPKRSKARTSQDAQVIYQKEPEPNRAVRKIPQATQEPVAVKKVKVGDLREQARIHHEERVNYFEMASEAWEWGDGAGAKRYSNLGHKHAQLMDEANDAAVDVLIAECQPGLEQTNTLDLHGFFVDEGIDYLDEVLEERETTYGRGYLTVITGKGLHSDGRVRLRPALIDYLNEGKYSYTEESRGLFRIRLHNKVPVNVSYTRRNNTTSHPSTRKIKQRYLNKTKQHTTVRNRFSALDHE